ncbi:unnamed protein product [Tuber aestivum]|uniref:Uncharacterized protein n=1 Tax=Tuber aestivum TaxID=59557 RepID=A0A292Q6H8_9PEZI|nr:unnamed protein product [Tuber aestivum]
MATVIPLSNFTFLNYAKPTPTLPTSLPFTLSTEPVTDLWRKPSNLIASNQPTLYTPLLLSTFVSATASFRADWKTLYDQAGLILIFPHSRPAEASAESPLGLPDEHPPAWIKSGIEFVNGIPNRGTVSAPFNSWADWSLVPSRDAEVSITFEREGAVDGGQLGTSLQIFLVDGEEKRKTMVREVTWVFEEELVKCGTVVWVGVYLAKPTRDGEGEGQGGRLEVEFESVEVIVRL